MIAATDSLEQRLLNDYQRGFPLLSRPFDRIAGELGTSTGQVIHSLRALQDSGSVSRVGPVFRPNTVGVSTLTAMAVPPRRLNAVAEIVNGYAEVNHNYEREHRYNLWFVLTADCEQTLRDVLRRIERDCGYRVLSLPLECDYHIDLGFHMSSSPCAARKEDTGERTPRNAHGARDGTVQGDSDLIRAIQSGLSLVERPYDEVAHRAGSSESVVIERIGELLDDGIIKRFGVVVRHHELGYRANAMAVWDLPEDEVDRLGRQLATLPWVTLCYRRRRHAEWPYNLYCMIHGRERDAVCQRIERINDRYGLEEYAHAVLFSRRRFKQRGACYRKPSPGEHHGSA